MVPATLSELLAQPRLQLGCVVSGSRAYGTATADSDEDLRGLFALPARAYLGLATPPTQLADARSDIVWYSLRRAIELLAQGNPNLLELVYTPDDCIRLDTPVFQRLRAARRQFVSQAVVQAHAGYAIGQVRKARGQHKWINQPQPEAPPQREDFCWVITAAALRRGAEDPVALRPQPLAEAGLDLARHQASKLPHGRECWRLFDFGSAASGVFEGGRIVHRSVSLADEQARFAGLLFFHEQAYEQAQSEHRHYWTWRRERNEARWVQQERGALDYDAKNLMHTIRLLRSALHLLDQGAPRVRFDGPDLAELRDIRAGCYRYEELLELAESLGAKISAALPACGLPAQASTAAAEMLLHELNELWEHSA